MDIVAVPFESTIPERPCAIDRVTLENGGYLKRDQEGQVKPHQDEASKSDIFLREYFEVEEENRDSRKWQTGMVENLCPPVFL
jgi:hypothetical protein